MDPRGTLIVGMTGQITHAQAEALVQKFKERGIDAIVISQVAALAVVP